MEADARKPRRGLTRRALGAVWAFAAASALVGCAGTGGLAGDPLPSWNEGPAKAAIVKFVGEVTREGGPSYVPPAERIAAFDNDGTLWSEQPLYFQFLFMIDQVKAKAAQHPEWQRNPAFRPLMAGDHQALAAVGERPLMELLVAANSGMTVDDYDLAIRAWLATAKHPKFRRPFTELVYQPQLELLGYLRANGFRTYIVSGGTIDFMRPWVTKAYGIPPEQVIGSSQLIRYDVQGGRPVLLREPKLDFIDDGPGKPVGIYRHIGLRPVLAFGNSDGDLQMLQYTAGGPGARLALIVHHDDGEREFAYDRDSKIGKLDKALDEAQARGWTVVSMKRDWKTVFPPPK